MGKESNLEIRQLVLAKCLYLHGCDHASRKDSVSRMLAIHHFDNAVEIVLKCVAVKQGIKPEKKYFYFEELLDKIKELPLKEQMRGLHNLRNIIQHQGDIPSAESVIKYQGYTMDFFKEVCHQFFNISYEELYLSDLIEKERLRETLLKAEQAFGKEEFIECIELCDDALIAAVFEETDIFGAAGMLTGYWGASEGLKRVLSDDYLERYREKEYYEPVKDLREAIIRLGQAVTTMQFLDEYRVDFLRFRQIIETPADAFDEQLREKAEFCLRFVTNLILKWQEEGLFETKSSV
mgnify:CR=1 FL=1